MYWVSAISSNLQKTTVWGKASSEKRVIFKNLWFPNFFKIFDIFYRNCNCIYIFNNTYCKLVKKKLCTNVLTINQI